MRRLLILLVAFIAMAGIGHTHSGGRDQYGCHNNKALGWYECHEGPLAGQHFANQAAMLLVLNTPAQPTLDPKDEQIADLTAQVTALTAQVAQKDISLATLQAKLVEKDAALSTMTVQVQALTVQATTVQTQLTKAQADLAACNAKVCFAVAVSWSEVAEASGYKLQCGTVAGGPYPYQQDVPKPSTFYMFKDLPPSKYYCQVAAYDAAGNQSAWSVEATNQYDGQSSWPVVIPNQIALPSPPTPTYSCAGPLGPCKAVDGKTYTLVEFNAGGIGAYRLAVDGTAVGCADNAALRIGTGSYDGHIQSQQGPKHCDGSSPGDQGHWFDFWSGTWTDIGS